MGISKCCRVNIEEVLQEAKNAQINGIVLTNHYVVYYAFDRDYLSLAKKCVGEYNYAKSLSEKMNEKVFLGIELNYHPLYEGTHFEQLTKRAIENGKILTCGRDYHADAYRVKCGVYFPNDVKEEIDIGKYLLSVGVKKLCIQEVGSKTVYDC